MSGAAGGRTSNCAASCYTDGYSYTPLDLVSRINYNGAKEAYDAVGSQTSIAYPDGTIALNIYRQMNLPRVFDKFVGEDGAQQAYSDYILNFGKSQVEDI